MTPAPAPAIESSPDRPAPPLRARRSSRAKAGSAGGGQGWLYLFLAFDPLAQVGLFFFGSSSLVRLPMRIGVYALSLLILVATSGKRARRYPPGRVLPLIIGVFAIQQFHPDGDRPIAQFASFALYLSVLAPLIWGSRIRLNDPMRTLRRVVTVLWVFYTLSAIAGVLQVKYPGRFDGALSANFTRESIMPHVFKLADGSYVIKPRGLSDNPGGAAIGGVYSILFGMGLLVQSRRNWLKVLAVGGMIAGLFCIYICQGRTNLILVSIDAIVLMAVLFRRGLFGRANVLLVVVATVATIGTISAFAVGGEATINRFNTLIAEDAGTVVYKNRGVFLDQMLREDAYSYPLGAGMGRWGMMNSYFGDGSRALWAEITWQALLYDGGLPQVFLYAVLLLAILQASWVAATRARSTELGIWAGVVCGCNVSAIAASFVFPIFSTSLGLEVMLLNATMYACYAAERARLATRRDVAPARLPGSVDAGPAR